MFLVKNILANNDKPLLARQISNHIYHKFDGYVISKSEVTKILWGELKSTVIYDKENYTYQLKKEEKDKKIETTNEPQTDKNLLYHIKEALKFIESKDKVTVSKITYILRHELNLDYNLSDVRRLFNKNDVEIFDAYEKLPRINTKPHKNLESKTLNELCSSHLKLEDVIKIINEEQARLGTLEGNLLAENIIFRLKKGKWG